MNPRFRKSVQPKLSRAEQVRQGRVVNAAQAAMPTVDAVRAFLTTRHDGLRGRPLDLAVASDAGLVAVEAAIVAEHGGRLAHG
jgi:hypothetical protein